MKSWKSLPGLLAASLALGFQANCVQQTPGQTIPRGSSVTVSDFGTPISGPIFHGPSVPHPMGSAPGSPDKPYGFLWMGFDATVEYDIYGHRRMAEAAAKAARLQSANANRSNRRSEENCHPNCRPLPCKPYGIYIPDKYSYPPSSNTPKSGVSSQVELEPPAELPQPLETNSLDTNLGSEYGSTSETNPYIKHVSPPRPTANDSPAKPISTDTPGSIFQPILKNVIPILKNVIPPSQSPIDPPAEVEFKVEPEPHIPMIDDVESEHFDVEVAVPTIVDRPEDSIEPVELPEPPVSDPRRLPERKGPAIPRNTLPSVESEPFDIQVTLPAIVDRPEDSIEPAELPDPPVPDLQLLPERKGPAIPRNALPSNDQSTTPRSSSRRSIHERTMSACGRLIQ